MAEMTDILWWVQLADCTTFDDWKEMRDALIHLPMPAGAAMGYSWHGEMPEAISVIGNGEPMDVDELMLQWAPHIHNDEYIILVEMKRTDVLSRHAATWYVLTANDCVCVKGIDAARYILTSVTSWGE